MTRKRFKKILMGRYNLSRNTAEKLSQEQNREIVEIGHEVYINKHYHILQERLKPFMTELKAEDINKWGLAPVGELLLKSIRQTMAEIIEENKKENLS